MRFEHRRAILDRRPRQSMALLWLDFANLVCWLGFTFAVWRGDTWRVGLHRMEVVGSDILWSGSKSQISPFCRNLSVWSFVKDFGGDCAPPRLQGFMMSGHCDLLTHGRRSCGCVWKAVVRYEYSFAESKWRNFANLHLFMCNLGAVSKSLEGFFYPPIFS